MAGLNITDLYSVKGKTALITGGASGLGLMMATAFVKNGGHVIIASRKEKQLSEVTKELNKLGPGSCEYIVANVGNRDGCEKLIQDVKKKYSKLHILVNNSGTTWGDKFTDFSESNGWDRVLGTNVKAIFYLSAGLSDLLEKDANNIDPGRIVNISSVAGIEPKSDEGALSAPGHGLWSYHASKAAANHLTKSLAITLGKRLITVNAICPGPFPSKMTKFGIENNGDALTSAQPLGRIGTTEDMAGLFLFLVSRAGAHISGAIIPIDGGATLAAKSAL